MKSELFFELLFLNKVDFATARKYLIALYEKGESAQDIISAVRVMREHMIPLDISDDIRGKVFDVVGTGGDKSGTFNISSTVSLLLASCGVMVAKHGNRGYTSKSGSSDMMESLGINLSLSLDSQVKLLQETNFTYMFAPNHHPAMRYITPIRKDISHRTIFNIIGPLANPAMATKQLLGVFSPDFIDRMASSLQKLKTKSSIVISSNDGLDEVSISDKTFYSVIKDNKITKHIFNPKDYNMNLFPKSAVIGGDSKENARIAYNILSGQLQGAKRNIVVINAAFSLLACEKVDNIRDGITLANEAIDSKKAFNKLNQILTISKRMK